MINTISKSEKNDLAQILPEKQKKEKGTGYLYRWKYK